MPRNPLRESAHRVFVNAVRMPFLNHLQVGIWEDFARFNSGGANATTMRDIWLQYRDHKTTNDANRLVLFVIVTKRTTWET
jgi:hypothetical protein